MGSENEGEGETRRNVPPTPHPTSVSAESTFSALPSHRSLDASRRYPVWEVVDFWEGPIPGRGSIEETSATEERWAWVGRGGSGDYSERCRSTPLATKPNRERTDVHSHPATTKTLPAAESECADSC